MTDSELALLLTLLKKYNTKSALGPRTFEAVTLLHKQITSTLTQRANKAEDDAKGWAC